MSLALDPVTEYQRAVGASIQAHRDADGGGPLLTTYLQNVIDFVGQHKETSKENAKYKEEGDERIFAQLNNLSQMAGLGTIIPSIPFIGGTTLGYGTPSNMWAQAKRTAEGLFTTEIFGSLFRPETVAWVEDRYNQVLEERGYLKFHFNDNATPHTEFTLPFFENPDIQESRQAKYAVNDIMSRNEPYRLFTGAQPRQVRLSFKLTLPHIFTFAIATRVREAERIVKMWSRTGGWSKSNKIIAQEFLKDEMGKKKEVDLDQGNFEDAEHSEFLKRERDDAIKKVNEFAEWLPKQENAPYSEGQLYMQGKMSQSYTNMITYVHHLIECIRSSVIGASNPGPKRPGPPVVSLKFGTLFTGETFTVDSYDIRFDGKAGYSNLSLIPRVIQVSLVLKSYGKAYGWDERFVRIPLG